MKLSCAALVLLAVGARAFSPPFPATVAPRRHSLFAATEDKIAVDVGVNGDVTGITANVTASSISESAASLLEMSVPDLVEALEEEAELAVQELVDDECAIEYETGGPVNPECADEELKRGFRSRLKGIVRHTLSLVRSGESAKELEQEERVALSGDLLEEGWERRGGVSALRRNAEVWKFALKNVFKVLKARKQAKNDDVSDEEASQALTDAAIFLRDGLLELGPTFVKLGQVVSTRTDVLPKEYTDVLKSLQDEVPGFSGAKAKEIVTKELGRPCDEVFTDFSEEPLKAASLGQVHTAFYNGKKVAIKVQRAGLKELFDVDLKNLKKLAELLDKFDPKTDGADRNWTGIYEESERLLYLEIDYLNEAANCERFAKDFKDIPYVRVPNIYHEVSTPRVLTMEFIESFKLTDTEQIDALGLDRKVLANQVADAFLRQIVETAYFHCDPHPGNECVDSEGNLVFYDFGMMDELKPNVREGFRTFCTALFEGGPMIDDLQLAKNAKVLVDGVEQAGVLARGADRLAVEKLARYFMRTFKDNQLGKKGAPIKQTIGTDLQTLTENNVFRFPTTFTFIFRAFASVEGIGKDLDADFDLGKMSQPFIEKFIDAQKGFSNKAEKNINIFQRATGLNEEDINTALTSPRKIQYVEETLRSMENGQLKIRVRSLENEKALERMALTQGRAENILLASVMLNVVGLVSGPLLSGVGAAGAAFFGFKAFMTNAKIKKFDKTQAKFVQTKFEDGEGEAGV